MLIGAYGDDRSNGGTEECPGSAYRAWWLPLNKDGIVSSIQVQTVSCPVCQSGNDALEALVSKLRGEGRGYKYTWGVAVEQGFTVTRDQMQEHCAHVERTVMSAHADAEDRGEEKTLEWYKRHGIDELPPGFVAGTIAISNGTHTSWFRTKAEQAQADRVEVRQAGLSPL